MATLEAVLAAPKKAKTPTDPNQKVLRKLARQGWNDTIRGTKTVMVRQYDDGLYLTNTFMMRRWESFDDVSLAIRSVVPDGSVDGNEMASRDELMATGFEMDLTAGAGGSWMNGGRTCPDMKGVWPTDVPVDEITSWEPNEDDPTRVFGVTDCGVRVMVNAKYLAACTDGITNPRVWAAVTADRDIRKPLVITGDHGLWIYSILMPVRA